MTVEDDGFDIWINIPPSVLEQCSSGRASEYIPHLWRAAAGWINDGKTYPGALHPATDDPLSTVRTYFKDHASTATLVTFTTLATDDGFGLTSTNSVRAPEVDGRSAQFTFVRWDDHIRVRRINDMPDFSIVPQPSGPNSVRVYCSEQWADTAITAYQSRDNGRDSKLRDGAIQG